MPRKKKTKSKRKQDAIRHNCGIAAWRMAAAEYLRKGKFIHLPKKGTPEHAEMKVRQKELMPVVQQQIDEMIKVEKQEELVRKKAHNAKRDKEIRRVQRRKAKEAKQKDVKGVDKLDGYDDDDNADVDITDVDMTDVVSSDTDGESAEVILIGDDKSDSDNDEEGNKSDSGNDEEGNQVEEEDDEDDWV